MPSLINGGFSERNEASNSQQRTKSILKTSQPETGIAATFGNNVRAKRQSLIDNGENNTTSRIDTVSLHKKLLTQEKKRRVSFAPDVTLRTVDFQDVIAEKPFGAQHDNKRFASEDPDESEMELTNPINNVLAVQRVPGNQLNENADDEADSQKLDMEITEIFTKNTATQEQNNSTANLQDVVLLEKGMKTTSLQNENHRNQNRSQNSEDELHTNTSMDLTTFQNLDKKVQDTNGMEERKDISDMDIDLSEGADMELTYMDIGSKNASNEEDHLVFDQQKENKRIPADGFEKVLTGNKPHSSTTNSRPSSLESGYASEEKLSPIPLKRLPSNPEQEHMPLPKKKHNKLSLSESISTLPSVDAYVHIPDDQNLLVKFLKSSHLDYLNNIPRLRDFNHSHDVKPFDFNVFKYKSDVSTAEVYKELYTNLPFLIILKYMWFELNRKISKSKSRFALLEKELSDNPSKLPALLSLFLNSSISSDGKTNLRNYIFVLKQNSDLVAESVWLNWRVNQVEGINSDLEDGLANLQAKIVNNESDSESIVKMREEAETVYNDYVREFEKRKIMHNQHTLKSVETENLNKVNVNISFEHKLKWVEKKNYLFKKYNVDIGDFESYPSRKFDILKALNSACSRQPSKADIEDTQLKTFEAKFADQRNNLKFIRSSNMIIAIIRVPSIKVFVADDSNDTSSIKMNLDNQDEFTKMWFKKLLHNVEDSNLKDKYEYLRYVMEARRKYEIISFNYKKLRLLFVTKTVETKSGGIIQFQSVNKWNKTLFQLTFSQFTQLVLYNKPVTSKRTVINYSTSVSFGENSSIGFSTEITEVLPWLINIS